MPQLSKSLTTRKKCVMAGIHTQKLHTQKLRFLVLAKILIKECCKSRISFRKSRMK